MDPAAFTDGMPGRLVRLSPGGWAFVPDPLPPQLHFSTDLVNELSHADRALSRLAGIGQTLPNPHLLINPFLRREAILSSTIEGTITTATQLVLFETTPTSGTSAAREVANYVGALEYGLNRLSTLPLSLRLIREAHKRLMTGVRGYERSPGEFRRIQNAIGQSGQAPESARFVPPPVPDMMRALDELERFLAAPSGLPPLIEIALAHYQFETIHPFMDGNGRIGRLLITLLLCARGYLPQPLLYLSAYFERHRDAYMDHLLRVSQAGTWTDWLIFFLRGVTEQSTDAIARSQRLIELRADYQQRAFRTRAAGSMNRLIDQLFIHPVLTLRRARELLGVTSRAAQLTIGKLQDAGIVYEVTGQPRNRVYVCSEILAVIEAPDAVAA